LHSATNLKPLERFPALVSDWPAVPATVHEELCTALSDNIREQIVLGEHMPGNPASPQKLVSRAPARSKGLTLLRR
jgi:hypothetical protein